MRKVFAAAAVSALALSACGSSDQAASFSSPGGVLAAISSTEEEKTSKVDFQLSISGTEGGAADIEMVGTGEMDYETNNAVITADLPASAGMEGTVESRVVDGISYVKTEVGGETVTPTPWVKVDLNQVAEEQGMEGLLQQGSSDPSDGLEMLRAAGDDVEEVGTEELRGDEVTHYTVTVNAANLSDSEDEDVRAQAEALELVYGNADIPTDVWVDEENRVRKMEMSMDLAALSEQMTEGEGEQVTGTMTMAYELYDFGAEVSIEAPPADQVTDATEMAGAGTGATGGGEAPVEGDMPADEQMSEEDIARLMEEAA
jgi:hypothetical protein